MWSLRNLRSAAFPEKDGLIVAALLYQSDGMRASTRLLAAPFPSADDVRYPALYLDGYFLAAPFPSVNDVRYPALYLNEKFLQFSDKQNAQPITVLSKLIDLVPPTLVLRLTRSALQELSNSADESNKIAEGIRKAYSLLKLLSAGDRPQYASTLILQNIMRGPQFSSWHRQLLTRSFLASLCAKDAESMVSAFASSIRGKLETQASLPETGNPGTAPGSLVKVTTVKSLAQLLEHAESVSPKFAVDVLAKVCKTATHIDIRSAIIQSLLSRLNSRSGYTSEPLVEDIFSTLETLVPVMGALNERKPLQEADWQIMEQTGELPEIYNDGQCLPPLLGLIHTNLVSYNVDQPTHRRRLIEGVVVPAIERSMNEHSRWIRLFIRKCFPMESSIKPLSIPVVPKISASFLEYTYSELPVSILSSYDQYTLANAFPTPEISTINEKISSDVALRDSNEGRHWLLMYGNSDALCDSILPSMLKHAWKPSILSIDGIHLPNIQDLCSMYAMLLIKKSGPTFTQWHKYIAALEPRFYSVEGAKFWSQKCKPVVQSLIDHVSSLHTVEWQRDSQRKPQFLPGIFPLRLWLLSYPNHSLSDGSAIDKAQHIAEEVSSLLGEIIEVGLAAHPKLEELRKAVLKCYGDERI